VSHGKLVGCHICVIRFIMPSSKNQCISPSNHKQQHNYRFHKAVTFFAFYKKNWVIRSFTLFSSVLPHNISRPFTICLYCPVHLKILNGCHACYHWWSEIKD